VRQVLDETVLSAAVAADAKSPHWLILTSTKVMQVAMDLVQPAHSVAVTAQSPTASRRPAVSQALSHLTGRPLHMHGPICPFMPFSTGPSNLSLMHCCIHAFMHATFMRSCMHHVSFPQVRYVQCYIATCVCSSPQLHVATSSSHCICLASCAIACQRSCSSGPIVLQRLRVVMYHSANCGVSPAAQSLPARTASPDLPA